MSDELRERIIALHDRVNQGLRVSASEVTEAYNQATGKNVASTNCASCLRRRIGEIYKMLNN